MEVNQALNNSTIQASRDSEMVACVAAEYSTSSTPWSGVWEKRRRLNTDAVLTQPELSDTEGGRARAAVAPRVPRSIKQEPHGAPEFRAAAVTATGPVAPPRPMPYTQEQESVDDLLSCLQSYLHPQQRQQQQELRNHFHPSAHQPVQLQLQPQQHYPQPPSLKPQQQQPQQPLFTACSSSTDARHSARQWHHDETRPVASGLPSCPPWILSSAPSFPPFLSDSHSRAPHCLTVGSGSAAVALHGRGASSPTPTSWRSSAATITTGTTAGPSPVTTGIFTSTSTFRAVLTSGAPAGATSSSAAGASVVTGGGRPAPAHSLKRRLPSHACPDSARPVSTVFPSALASPPPTTAIACLPRSISTLPTPFGAGMSPAASALFASMIRGSASPFSGAESVSGAPEGSCHRFLEDEVMLPEASAPATPPRSPGTRVAPEVSAPNQNQIQMLPAPLLVPELKAPVSAPEADGRFSPSGGQPFIGALQLLGFEMLGVEPAPGPHACQTQVVRVMLRLSPLVGSGSTVSLEAPAAAEPQPQPEASTAASHQPRSSRVVDATAPHCAEQPRQGAELMSTVQMQHQELRQEPQQYVQGQLQRAMTVSIVSALPEEPGQGLLQSTPSSDSLLESATSVTHGWLPAGAASEPALSGLDRLLSAAAAASAAAATAAEQIIPGASQLPALAVPRPEPEAFVEPDGSLLRGRVLQTACILIRLAKLVRAGLSVSLPWCEVDITASADNGSSALASSNGTGTTSSAAQGAAGRCGSSYSPVGLPQALAAAAAAGRRSVPLGSVLKVLSDFAGAARALQRAEVGQPASTAAGPEGAAEEYRALWPLMRRGRKCAESLMVRVERALTADVVSPAPSPAGSPTPSV